MFEPSRFERRRGSEFAHGISIALLFALAGEIRQRSGTLVFDDLGGLGKLMPFAGLAFGLATFAAIGLPGFANFAAEVMVFFGAYRVGASWEGFHLFKSRPRSPSGALSSPRFTCCALTVPSSWPA
jgi:hypothetical protein